MCSAVEKAVRRLLFQYKYIRTCKLQEMRLQGKDTAKSNELQDTMTWFLINHVVRDFENYRTYCVVSRKNQSRNSDFGEEN